MERRKVGWVVGGTLAAIIVGGGIAVAGATGGQDHEPLAGRALERAKAAALAHTGGGTVIEAEIGDDGGAYSVEVRLGSGDVVEITLDGDFGVIGQDVDDDGPSDEEDGPADD